MDCSAITPARSHHHGVAVHKAEPNLRRHRSLSPAANLTFSTVLFAPCSISCSAADISSAQITTDAVDFAQAQSDFQALPSPPRARRSQTSHHRASCKHHDHRHLSHIAALSPSLPDPFRDHHVEPSSFRRSHTADAVFISPSLPIVVPFARAFLSEHMPSRASSPLHLYVAAPLLPPLPATKSEAQPGSTTSAASAPLCSLSLHGLRDEEQIEQRSSVRVERDRDQKSQLRKKPSLMLTWQERPIENMVEKSTKTKMKRMG